MNGMNRKNRIIRSTKESYSYGRKVYRVQALRSIDALGFEEWVDIKIRITKMGIITNVLAEKSDAFAFIGNLQGKYKTRIVEDYLTDLPKEKITVERIR